MSTQTTQFIRLPQTLRDESPEIQALWSVCSFYLTLPGFSGSLKKAARRCCKRGSAFVPAWRELRRKYLKVIMLPCGENRFEARYELYANVRADLPDTSCLRASAARAYSARHGEHTVYNMGYFTPVPVSLLKDSAVSLKAKGIYIAMQRLFELRRHGNAVTISKDELMKRLRLQRSSTDAAWNELKSVGYLIQRRLIDEQTGLFGWGYELTDSPREIRAEEKPKIARKSDRGIIQTAEVREVALTAEEREKIRAVIRANIEYDVLIENRKTLNGTPYSPADIDGIVQIMTDAVCSIQPYLSVGGESVPSEAVREALMSVDSENITDLLDRFNRISGEIRNVRAYKLTALYNCAAGHGYALIG
ncbi:MAG: DUF6017 domain-containing protein [Acutalibacteraceae bacterium]